MTKGHNQSQHKQSGSTPQNAARQDENKHLKDSQKEKNPNQGRNKDKDPSGGTKGQNAI
ncbi:MAG TPA: hypothetical protein VIG72_00170 [Pontibacter sp.]